VNQPWEVAGLQRALSDKEEVIQVGGGEHVCGGGGGGAWRRRSYRREGGSMCEVIQVGGGSMWVVIQVGGEHVGGGGGGGAWGLDTGGWQQSLVVDGEQGAGP
jgi:hypothetical protein